MTGKNKTALISGVSGQDGSYLAEFLLEKGAIDLIVNRNEMRDKVASILSILLKSKLT